MAARDGEVARALVDEDDNDNVEEVDAASQSEAGVDVKAANLLFREVRICLLRRRVS